MTPARLLVCLALAAAGCGSAQREVAPPPVEAASPAPTDYLGRMHASLEESGIDPDALACNSRVLWAEGLDADAEALSADVEALYEPHLTRRASDDERTTARQGVAALVKSWMVRTLIVYGDAQNLGALALPGRTWSGDDGVAHPLVLFHSATTGDPDRPGSCFRSLVEQGHVRHVVNLYGGSVPLRDVVEAEARVARELDATYVDAADPELGYGEWREVAGDAGASPEQIAEASAAVARLIRDQILGAGAGSPAGNVYFHCAGGMHRSTVVDGILRRCLAGEPIEAVSEAMRFHAAYRDEEQPGGFEQASLDFVEQFDCSLLTAARPPLPATEAGPADAGEAE